MNWFNLFKTFIAAAALFLFVDQGQAQMTSGTPVAMNTAMIKLLGAHPAFTAEVRASITGPSCKPLHLTMNIACLDKEIRSEVDMDKINGGGMPAQAVAQMKQLGMDRVVSIIRPGKKAITLIYPNLRAYAELPMGETGASLAGEDLKMAKSALGKETVAGHPCVKSRVTFTDNKKQKQEILVWNATDLKNFPVKMRMDTANSEITMLYQHVNFTRPDAKQFGPPAGYTKYSDQLEIMDKAMRRLAGRKSRKN
ncbi:MAG TPA: DUF4412 domain-containing protein [Verrucomicrobiae bacterium]|nr:DUF4412 domain-containing protein [Verrucomicrobiae bacterium]